MSSRARNQDTIECRKNEFESLTGLEAAAARAAFEAFVEHADFPCLGAKSVVHNDNYEFCFLPPLGSGKVAAELHEQLLAYLDQFEGGRVPAELHSFVACFCGPGDLDEDEFERRLWSLLQELHEIDARNYPWAEVVDSNPASAEFSYSVGSVAFFLVGMSPRSSRIARRFPWPSVAFNFHAQFAELRDDGNWATMQSAIRERDRDLQGAINPELRDHGSGSQARQYSGCPHSTKDWVPAFRPLELDDEQ